MALPAIAVSEILSALGKAGASVSAGQLVNALKAAGIALDIKDQVTDLVPGGKTSNKTKGFMGGLAYPSDIVGLGVGIAGRGVENYFKQKAAKQVARGNAAQHVAASLSHPNSFSGNAFANRAKITADAGAAQAQESLAIGDTVRGSTQDIKNYIDSINTMRRLIDQDALQAGTMLAAQRMLTHDRD